MTVGESHRTLREVVADELRAMIMRGDLKPGERLLEDRLADRLGVSRNPVREAIRALEGTGLVEVLPRRGAYVSQLDNDRIHQLLELRALLEGFAAERAATNRTDADLERLQKLIDEGRRASKENDVVRAAACHREFHRAIERASGNQYLEGAVAPLRHQTELVFSVLLEHRGAPGWEEHDRILAAIAERDGDEARDGTYAHMASVINDLDQRTEPTSTDP